MALTVASRVAERNVQVDVAKRTLKGILGAPADARGVVVFAHGSGSGRLSPRNQSVARWLQSAGMATLLIDLLEEDEAEDRRKVFDVRLLAIRLQGAAAWLRSDPETCELPLGYFGASTGAAAALIAAAEQPSVAAVVSRGGRPDLASGYLSRVTAPTLLIVGGNDHTVLELNRQALSLLRCPKTLVVVPDATHLFPEPGALEEVADHAVRWFRAYLVSQAHAVGGGPASKAT
jgi:putative phosphoribosyl transferase